VYCISGSSFLRSGSGQWRKGLWTDRAAENPIPHRVAGVHHRSAHVGTHPNQLSGGSLFLDEVSGSTFLWTGGHTPGHPTVERAGPLLPALLKKVMLCLLTLLANPASQHDSPDRTKAQRAPYQFLGNLNGSAFVGDGGSFAIRHVDQVDLAPDRMDGSTNQG